jgi:hypothetical protein
MTRAEYMDKLIADERPEDAPELQRLLLEEIDECLADYEESEKRQEAFSKKVRETSPDRDQAGLD